MDVQLQELIDRIKSEGIASAEKQAAGIVEEAEKKAGAIIGEAETKAQDIIEAAEKKEEQMAHAGKDALQQAGRDLILNLQTQLTSLFTSVIAAETADVLTGDTLESAVTALISSWSTESSGKVDILLSEKEFEALESGLRKKLSDKLAEGIELKPAADIEAGFRISVKDGSAYFDFTPSEIAAVLAQYLNPRLAEMLTAATAG
jgi:V/A-type H+/Na+-transporting ATPase subunit E